MSMSMLAGTQRMHRPEPRLPYAAEGAWHKARISTAREMGRILEDVVSAMDAEGYSERDVFAVRLALEEAVVNGIKHGHGNDPTKLLTVRYQVGPDIVLAEVEDQGPGFDPDGVPDPLAPE